jgi:hypothetical protein
MDLTEAEAAQLRRSAKTLWENCQLLGLWHIRGTPVDLRV